MRLIDADEIEKQAVYGHIFYEDGTENLGFTRIILGTVIKDAPTIDTELVRHGHWISSDEWVFVPLDKNGCPERACYCSVCGEWLVASDEYRVKGKYCPNCGAKMDEVK